MADLTLLLYTANRLDEAAAARIRAHLRRVTWDRYPIISVSQKPLDFGRNICVGEIGVNKYNAYWQVYVGALEVETEYVAAIDDDVLYAPEHFAHRPPLGTFLYEGNYWFCQDGLDYYWRAYNPKSRDGMWGCIARTETLCANLEARFRRFPVNPWADPTRTVPRLFWGEPGAPEGDRLYGRADARRVVESARPCLVFLHTGAMGYTQLSRFYRRYGWPSPENRTATLPRFGTVADVRREYWS